MIQDFPRFLGKRVSLSLFIPYPKNHCDFYSSDPLVLQSAFSSKGRGPEPEGIMYMKAQKISR
jgi:hypothetical protein